MDNVCNRTLCPWQYTNKKRVHWKNFTCSYYKFNSVHFWSYLKQMKKCNITFKPSNQLIYEKSINLNNNKDNRLVLYIGLNPEDRFQIYARLEKQCINDCFMFTLDEIEDLLNFVNKEKNENSRENLSIGDRFVIYQNQLKDFEILSYDDGRRITIDKSSLKKLICTQKIINHFILSLENDISKSEKYFIQLLNNFCMGKTFNEACDAAWMDTKYTFFDDIAKLKCDCTNKNFTLEIAIKCESWFGYCVPWFLKTKMLIESERLNSFDLKWPHDAKYVSINEMAKCGLYSTGIDDNVKCVFCNVMLHKWQEKDKPILDHFKYNPKCPFLYDFRKTSNISDIGKIEEVDELIALLPSERSIDEIDG